MEREKVMMEVKKSVSVFDLFRYDSLRTISTFISLSYFINHICFLSYNAVIDHVGLTSAINSAVLYISQILAIPLLIVVVPFFRRLVLFHFSLGCALLFSIATHFIIVPQECRQNINEQLCKEGLIQLLLMAVVRFAYSFNTSVIFIIMMESFPASIRNIGIGFPCAFGGIGSLLSQTIFVAAYEKGLSIFFLSALIFGVNMILMIPIAETKGIKELDEIIEVKEEMEKDRREKARLSFDKTS